VLAMLETGDYRCSAFRIARRAPVLLERASGGLAVRMGRSCTRG
jgi:hypothetical protein